MLSIVRTVSRGFSGLLSGQPVQGGIFSPLIILQKFKELLHRHAADCHVNVVGRPGSHAV